MDFLNKTNSFYVFIHEFIDESTLKRVLQIKCHPELVSGSIDFIEVMDSDPARAGRNDFHNLFRVDLLIHLS